MYELDMFDRFSGIEDMDFGYSKNASPCETGGPVVKTGPTAGQNRSRNKNGQWRRKRSDAGKTRN